MAVLGLSPTRRRQPERRRAAAVRPGPDNPRRPSTAASPPQRLHGRLCPLRAAAHRPHAQLPPRYVKVNSAPTPPKFPSMCCTRTASAERAMSFPALEVQGLARHLHSFLAHLARCNRKKPQRSAPAHRTPRGSRQRAGIAARGLALPRRQQRDEVVDKWRQAQLPRPARHQRAGNCFKRNDTADAAFCSPRLLPPPGMTRGMQHMAAREAQGGGSPDWGRAAARCLWQHLLVCIRCSGIFIGRGARSGLRGA